MSDLVGNPEDRFSHVTAHIYFQGLCVKQSTDMVQRLFDIIEKLTPSTFGKCHSVIVYC